MRRYAARCGSAAGTFANAAALRHFIQQSSGTADFIVRTRWKSVHLSDEDGQAFGLIEHLGRLPAEDGPHEVQV